MMTSKYTDFRETKITISSKEYGGITKFHLSGMKIEKLLRRIAILTCQKNKINKSIYSLISNVNKKLE